MDPERWKSLISKCNTEWAKDAWYDEDLALVEALLLLEKGDIEHTRELIALTLDLPVPSDTEIDMVHWLFARWNAQEIKTNIDRKVEKYRQSQLDESCGGDPSPEQVLEAEDMANKSTAAYRVYLAALLEKYDTLTT